MAHYAFLDENNIVTEVIVGVEETEIIDGMDVETAYSKLRNQVCKRTSYNGKIRRRYAGVGYFYDSANDVFIEPQPYPSWTLDNNFDWQPPKQRPENGYYSWNEQTQDWEAHVAPNA